MKRFLIVSLLIFGGESYADKIDELQKIVAIQQAQIAQIRNSAHPVGSILQSVLDDKTFLSSYGASWRLLKGKLNIENTKLCTMIKSVDPAASCILANASGSFLRNAGGNAAALGTIQDNAVQLPTMTAKLDHTHSNVQFKVYTSATSNTFEASGTRVPTPGGLLGGSSAYGSTEPKDIHFSGTSTIIRSDNLSPNETRPLNLTVNFFIRVNE